MSIARKPSIIIKLFALAAQSSHRTSGFPPSPLILFYFFFFAWHLPSVLLDDNAARVDSAAPTDWCCNAQTLCRRRPCEWERRTAPDLGHVFSQRLALTRPSARQLCVRVCVCVYGT